MRISTPTHSPSRKLRGVIVLIALSAIALVGFPSDNEKVPIGLAATCQRDITPVSPG